MAERQTFTEENKYLLKFEGQFATGISSMHFAELKYNELTSLPHKVIIQNNEDIYYPYNEDNILINDWYKADFTINIEDNEESNPERGSSTKSLSDMSIISIMLTINENNYVTCPNFQSFLLKDFYNENLGEGDIVAKGETKGNSDYYKVYQFDIFIKFNKEFYNTGKDYLYLPIRYLEYDTLVNVYNGFYCLTENINDLYDDSYIEPKSTKKSVITVENDKDNAWCDIGYNSESYESWIELAIYLNIDPEEFEIDSNLTIEKAFIVRHKSKTLTLRPENNSSSNSPIVE